MSKSKSILVMFEKSDLKITFSELKNASFFYSGTTLYKKINNQDLDLFGIKGVNAVSVFGGGLTLFYDSEEVFEVINF